MKKPDVVEKQGQVYMVQKTLISWKVETGIYGTEDSDSVESLRQI